MFVILTEYSDRVATRVQTFSVYIRSDAITMVKKVNTHKTGEARARVYLEDGLVLFVTETPDEVVTLIASSLGLDLPYTPKEEVMSREETRRAIERGAL